MSGGEEIPLGNNGGIEKMMFTERDRKLFQLLGQFRIMTLKQIQEHVFSGASRSIVQRRLGLFRRRGVLRSVQSSRYGELAWTLVSDTARAIDLDPRAFSRNPNLYCIEHDLILSEIGLHWMRLGILDRWTPAIFFELEQSGRNAARRDHIPDARVQGSLFQGLHNYVEYENSFKTRSELRRVIRQYNNFGFEQIFYFWRNESVARIIREIEGLKQQHRHRIWVADHSIENGIPDSFNCVITGEKLDLKILSEAGPNPAPHAVSSPRTGWSSP